MALRAFPVLYASDVELIASFYQRLGFQEQSRVMGDDDEPGYIGLKRGATELAVVTEESPRQLAGVEPGTGPRHELFVYVSDLDATLRSLQHADAVVLREPMDMPWGERIAYLRDPEGNIVTLAMAAIQ
jgi:lactoylglutathione lyase